MGGSKWSTWRMYKILPKDTESKYLQFGSYKTRARNKEEATRKARANTDVIDFTMLEESDDAFKRYDMSLKRWVDR